MRFSATLSVKVCRLAGLDLPLLLAANTDMVKGRPGRMLVRRKEGTGADWLRRISPDWESNTFKQGGVMIENGGVIIEDEGVIIEIEIVIKENRNHNGEVGIALRCRVR